MLLLPKKRMNPVFVKNFVPINDSGFEFLELYFQTYDKTLMVLCITPFTNNQFERNLMVLTQCVQDDKLPLNLQLFFSTNKGSKVFTAKPTINDEKKYRLSFLNVPEYIVQSWEKLQAQMYINLC